MLSGKPIDWREWAQCGTREVVAAGVQHIVAEAVSVDPESRQLTRQAYSRHGILTSQSIQLKKDKAAEGKAAKKGKGKDKDEAGDRKRKRDDEKAESRPQSHNSYGHYADFQMPVWKIRHHQVLAIDRGEKEKTLTVAVGLSSEHEKERVVSAIARLWRQRTHHSTRSLVDDAVKDAYTRLLSRRAVSLVPSVNPNSPLPTTLIILFWFGRMKIVSMFLVICSRLWSLCHDIANNSLPPRFLRRPTLTSLLMPATCPGSGMPPRAHPKSTRCGNQSVCPKRAGGAADQTHPREQGVRDRSGLPQRLQDRRAERDGASPRDVHPLPTRVASQGTWCDQLSRPVIATGRAVVCLHTMVSNSLHSVLLVCRHSSAVQCPCLMQRSSGSQLTLLGRAAAGG